MIWTPDRRCILCHRPITQRNPVHLVMGRGEAIIGPFHAQCAGQCRAMDVRELRALQARATVGRKVPMELAAEDPATEGENGVTH